MGVCTGVTSACAIGGYALESKYVLHAIKQRITYSLPFLPRCHNGKVILYDTVTDHKWTVTVRKHGIKFIVEELLSQDWKVPEAIEQSDCVVS